MTNYDPDGKLHTAIFEVIERARLYRSCVTCHQFDGATEGCGLAQGMRPPARVIALGCDHYVEEPPF